MQSMLNIWAKTSQTTLDGDQRTLPLMLHMIDVAIAAEIIMEQWSIIFDQDDTKSLHRLGIFLAGAHDIGKAIPQFQRQHDSSYQLLCENFDFNDISLSKPYGTAAYVPHGYASFVVLNQYLRESMQLNRINARWLSRCVAGHHGVFPSMDDVRYLKPESFLMGVNASWGMVRTQMLDILAELLNIPKPFVGSIHLSHANIIKLAGLTTVADWVASQATDLQWQDDFMDVQTYYVRTKSRLYDVLSRIGWARLPLKNDISLDDILQGRTPRPLHIAVDELMKSTQARLVLIEAPTGEGKTEASFVVATAHGVNAGYMSTFFALPTQATSNQMYTRVASWLQHMLPEPTLTHLVHGGNAFSEAYAQSKQKMVSIYDHDSDTSGNGIQAESWFTTTKRIMLASQGVGTVDQALMSVLNTKHGFVRLFGLASKVVVIDEVHAYDVYTSTLLDNLLEWLKALGCTVVLLSATLPATRRRHLLGAWGVGDYFDVAYPRLVVIDEHDQMTQQTVESSQSGRSITIQCIESDELNIARFVESKITDGGIALIICNTVARSQDIYNLIIQNHPSSEVLLLHSRMTNAHRAVTEQKVTDALGLESNRPQRMIVVGTQVLEQSLDIDADVMISDIAPIDLLIQRMGRLHRHTRSSRPESFRTPTLYVATPVPNFDEQSWFGGVGIVYESSVLLRTYAWLQTHQQMAIPDDVEPAINAVYERLLNPAEYVTYLQHADAQLDELRNKKIWQSSLQLLGDPNQTAELFDGSHVLASDDEHATHYLRPRTRDGDPSLSVICVDAVGTTTMITGVEISLSNPPRFNELKNLFMPALMKVSSKRLIWLIKHNCVMPQSWQRVAALRGVYVLLIHGDGITNIPNVQYREDLGLYLKSEPSMEDEI